MARTYNYLSVFVSRRPLAFSESGNKLLVTVKFAEYEKTAGFTGKRRVERFEVGSFAHDVYSIRKMHEVIRTSRRHAFTDEGAVGSPELYSIGVTMAMLCQLHSSDYSTWVGEYYMAPSWSNSCGLAGRYRGFLITEAPVLDCGHWEEVR